MRNANAWMAMACAALTGAACIGDGDELAEIEQAASVHLKGGRNAEPTFFDQITTLRSIGALSGLGDGDVEITMSATGTQTVSCINPGTGEHRPPGRQPGPVTLTGSQLIPEEEIKNGNVTFNVITQPPQNPIPGAPDCTNGQGAWEERIEDISFTSATITIGQRPSDSTGSYTTVLTVSCSFSPATQNQQPVPGSQVTCSTST